MQKRRASSFSETSRLKKLVLVEREICVPAYQYLECFFLSTDVQFLFLEGSVL